MSFWNCVQDAIDEGSADRERGRKAQERWKELSDRYERQGHPRHTAEVMAAEDVKASFKREAGEKRHVYTAKMASNRKHQAEVALSKTPERDMTDKVEALDYQHRALVRRFNGRLGKFLREHHRDLLGRVTKPAQMKNIVRELHGEATGDAGAALLANGLRDALEDMRLMFNEAGGIMGKLDNFGLPHSHNRRAVTRAGFRRWFEEIDQKIDWSRMEDRLTGKPFQAEGGDAPSLEIRQSVLREIYDNIAYGKESREAVYGRPKGVATYRRGAEQRILHFKDADGWMDYNKKFGTGDAFTTLMSHVHRMARDISMMREFGPNPHLGAEYRGQLLEVRARNEGSEALADKVRGNARHAQRMIKVISGGSMPDTLLQDYVATFFSSARHVMTAAFLDRAVIASISDINTMRLAATSMGMNPGNLIKRHVDLLKSGLSRDEALRAGWVADTLSDAGTALARFQMEVPPAEVAERLSSAAMRVQGLSHWTDMGRVAFQMEMSGLFASQAGRALDQVDEPLRGLLKKWRVSEKEWAAFTNQETFFNAENGATFASPIYWREATDLPAREADDLFAKIQGLVEEQTEIAVPTQSVWARAFVEGGDAPPGSIAYEVMKSGLMFKSFAMTFTINQIRQINNRGGILSKGGALYAANLAAGATVMGALALQIGDLAMGRDPQDMTTPEFWGRAAMKGGGFGILGDIVSTGQASWGGGFPEYVAGPVPQAIGDVWNLTFKNAFEFATGKDTNFAKEIARFGKRYFPMGQMPAIGPAGDRMIWDQLQLLLDPDSADAMAKASKKRKKDYGGGEYWLPGEIIPGRLPNLRTAIGG